MRILHLRASNFYGGPERQLHLHARLAVATPYQVAVASFTEGGRAPEFLGRIAQDGLETHVIGVRNAYDPAAVGALRDLLRSARYDLLCSHDYRCNMIAYMARRSLSCGWVSFSRGFTREDLKVRAFQRIDRLVVRRADHVVAVAEAQKRRLIGFGLAPDGISVVHNAIDGEAMAAVKAVDLRARHGFADSDFVCVAGGRFSPEKGQLDLIRAAASALARRPHLRFLLFGDGPQRATAVRLIRELGHERQILCPGFESDMLGCIRGADLLLNPSHSEGLPNIVLEAMALGTPVVATDVGGLPELIEDGVCGLLVPATEVERLSEAIVSSSDDAVARSERSARALRRVRDQFSFSRQLEQLVRIYDRFGKNRR